MIVPIIENDRADGFAVPSYTTSEDTTMPRDSTRGSTA